MAKVTAPKEVAYCEMDGYNGASGRYKVLIECPTCFALTTKKKEKGHLKWHKTINRLDSHAEDD